MKQVTLLMISLFSVCALATENQAELSKLRNNECWGKFGSQRLVNEEALGHSLAYFESIVGQYNTYYEQQEKIYYAYEKKGYSHNRKQKLDSLQAELSVEKDKIRVLRAEKTSLEAQFEDCLQGK